MRTPTSNFVTLFDVSIVVGVCSCGVYAGLVGLTNAQDLNKKLSEADRELNLFNDKSRDRRRGIILLSVIFVSITGMIIMDAMAKSRIIRKTKLPTQEEHEGCER